MLLVVVLQLNFAINVTQVGYTLMNAIETQNSMIANALIRREQSSKYSKGRLRVLGQGGMASSESTSMYMYAPPRW